MNFPGKRASFSLVLVGTVFVSFFSTASLAMSPMLCNDSSTQACPAALYYVPETTRTPEETASLFRVNADVVNRTVDGFLVLISCTCLDQHNHYAWRVDYDVHEGNTWGSVSSMFGSFLLDKPGSVLVASRIVTLELLCGCSPKWEMVSYCVRKGDTLFSVCERFGADLSETVLLNELDDPSRINVGDTIIVPVKASSLQNLTLFDISDKDKRTTGSAKSKATIVIGAVAAAVTVSISAIILVFWMYHKRKKASRLINVESCQRNPKMPSPRQVTGSEASVISAYNSDKATRFRLQ